MARRARSAAGTGCLLTAVGAAVGVAAVFAACGGLLLLGSRQKPPRPDEQTAPAPQLPAAPAPPVTAPGPVSPVELAEMIEEFNANEVAAGEKYKGRVVQVDGVVMDVKRNPLTGDPYVAIRPWGVEREPLIAPLRAYFPAGTTAALGRIEKGSAVTVEGRFNMRLYTVIFLADCKLK